MAPKLAESSYAQNLWQLANIVTGFSVAQAIVVLIAMASSSTFEKNVSGSSGLTLFVTVLVALAQAALIAVVRGCHARQRKLLHSDATAEIEEAIRFVRRLQSVTIASTGIFFIGIIIFDFLKAKNC